ncbi:MAG: trypsin-like peptidase domain-containing protein [Clostridia bacterium]|nr:trypsin-like peptidase domain-containing protein [Clostridia bacterium]
MKKFVKILMIMLILPMACIITACSNTEEVVSIKDIKRTGSVGELVDVYTITYTNGETDTFTIVNGQDGLDLYQNITINDLYNQVKGSKPEGYSLLDFIDEYLDIKLDASAVASAHALRSAVSIFVEHEVEITDYDVLIKHPEGYYTYDTKKSIAWNAGAGVIYNLNKDTGDAYIITNYHVCYSGGTLAEDGIAKRFTTYVYGAESIDMYDLTCLKYYNDDCVKYRDLFDYDAEGLPIIDYGYGAIEAEYVGGSEAYDIAVLKVTNSEVLKNSDCLAVDVKDSDEVTAGSTAIAVGNPDASGIAVTNGVISVESEYIQVQIDNVVVLREFRIDTPVNPGNSGGGLFDGKGKLVGIVNAKTTDTSVENMSYAIPSNVATRVAQSIIDNCDGATRTTNKVFIGITIETTNSKAHYNQSTGLMGIREEVSVSGVNEDSLADVIGLKVGDVLTSVQIVSDEGIKEIEINHTYSLIDAMLLVRVGDSVIFNYSRAGVEGSVETAILTNQHFIEVK